MGEVCNIQLYQTTSHRAVVTLVLTGDNRRPDSSHLLQGGRILTVLWWTGSNLTHDISLSPRQ